MLAVKCYRVARWVFGAWSDTYWSENGTTFKVGELSVMTLGNAQVAIQKVRKKYKMDKYAVKNVVTGRIVEGL